MSTNRIQREEKTLKEKLQHFWKYYKFHALIWAVGIVLLGSAIVKEALTPKYQLRGMFLNASQTNANETANTYETIFTDTYKLDTSKKQIEFNTSYICEYKNEENATETEACIQAMLTGKEADTLDFVIAASDEMQNLVYNTIVGDTTLFSDLRLMLNQELYATYEPYMLYIDLTVVEKLEKAYDKGEDTSSIPLPDMAKPEDMKQPIPILIDVTNCEKLAQIYSTPEKGLAFGIISETPNYENTRNFIEFIMAKEN